jgi:hypothetical protein
MKARRHSAGSAVACRLCLKARPLQLSHILPEFLYTAVYDTKHQYLVTPLSPNAPERTEQKGLREQLLCGPCEELLSRRERYASQLLFYRRGLRPFAHAGTIYVPGVDYVGFKLFLLGLLWKAASSSLPEFRNVCLDRSRSDRLRQLLHAEDPGTPAEFPCVIHIFMRHKEAFRHSIIPPYRIRYSGHRAYRLVFAGFAWTFVVSSHFTDSIVGNSVLRQDGVLPLHLLCEADERRFMRGISERLPPLS